MRYWLLPGILWYALTAEAQTAGGHSVYNFLKLPVSPQQTAIGGNNISTLSDDLTMGYQQPALLRETMDKQAGFVFSSLPAGSNHLFLTGSMNKASWATSFAASLQYFSYGNIPQTDASGNQLGSFHPKDYVVQLSGSRTYGSHWFYGSSIKFIHSNYGLYRSSAMALDIGVNYLDSARHWQAGLVLQNMGIQLRSYTGDGSDNLPFDFQLGITKRLAKAPLQFSLTLRELHRLLLYKAEQTGTIDHILQHFVFGTQLFIAEKVELTAGYNYLKRKELSIANTTNGLTGFSFGVGVLLPKFQLRYASAFHTNNSGFHQIGLNINFSGSKG